MSVTRSVLAAALIAALPASAQVDVKVNGLVIAWYSQMLSNNLRLNTPNPYYAFGGATRGSNPFQENGFSIRRTELYLSSKITDDISANVMFDPKDDAPILQDAFATWKPCAGAEVKVGQFKAPQTFEAASVSSPDLLFVDRAQFARRFADYRDRGITAAYTFGPKEKSLKVTLGAFNGTNRSNDGNAQKDIIARVDAVIGDHKFGAYTLQGVTDKADKGGTQTQLWGANGATAADIYAEKDATTSLGAFYFANLGAWHVDAEVVTGKLGRRYPTFLETGAPKREYLDQKYLAYWATVGYTFAQKHQVNLRHDVIDLNKGTDFYGPVNPYATATADKTPWFSETTLGYTYFVDPASPRKANVKLNLIRRSKNVLLPAAGQTGERGGDSLVAAFQIYF